MLQASSRGALAGAAATAVTTLVQPLDKRLFDSTYDDVEILLRISSATPTRWRCHARARRCSLSSANGHANLSITSVYLRGIDNTEIIHAIHRRPAPVIPANNGLL
jgi:hypothetical protein